MKRVVARQVQPLQTAGANLLLQRKCSCRAGASSLTGECDDCNKKRLGLQTKLRVGPPGDVYEQEADRVAQHVMSIPGTTSRTNPGRRTADTEPAESATITAPSISRVTDPLIARAGFTTADARDSEPPENVVPIAAGEEGETPSPAVAETDIRRRAGPIRPDSVGAGVEGALIARLRGGGEPLHAQTRSFMEPRFGHSFKAVRVFAQESDGRLARTLGARAFTTRQNIFFAPGEYQPTTQKGRELLAHELTHVIQQQGSSSQALQQQGLVQRAAHPCQTYAGYDKGADVETYNCTGLAHRNYKFLGLKDTKTLLASASAVDCKTGCARWKIGVSGPKIQHWFWEYNMHLEDHAGAVISIPNAPTHWTDFHTVGGMIDDVGSDMKQVYTKNGKRPVYGPESGPSHKPAAKNQLRKNDKTDALVTDASNWPVYQVRDKIVQSCFCTSCPKP